MTAYELIVKILKVVLKMALFAVSAVIGSAIVYIYVYQVIPKDIDPPDDTALMISRPKITDEENGYLKMMEAAWESGEGPFDASIFKTIPSLDDEEIERLAKKCETRLDKIDEALKLGVFQEPLESPNLGAFQEPHKEMHGHVPNYYAIRDLSWLRMAIAWKYLREGRETDSFEQLFNALKTGQALETASVTHKCFMMGDRIKNEAFENINAMVESGLINEDSYSQIVRELSKYRQSPQGFKNAIKSEYAAAKARFLETEKNRVENLKGIQKIAYMLDPQRGSLFKVNRTIKLTMDNYVLFIESFGGYYKDINLAETVEPQESQTKYIENWPRALATSNIVGELSYLFETREKRSARFITEYYFSEFKAEGLRAAIAALAYEREYDEFPASLESLVPEFLPSVPIDPFDGSPLRYDKGKRAVYSIGQNLIDEGGSSKVSALDTSSNMAKITAIHQDDYVVYIPEPKRND